ncbi:MAG: hypothetical protein IJV40_03405 [Oscillospiraceae bacterium]|nr:hypothetical protein [Oscillospiraceae bacterium]
MGTKYESLEAKKAAFYDLFVLLKQTPGKSYTVEELEEIVQAYLKGIEASE